MPYYRVYIDGIDTGHTVTANNFVNAYFDIASSRPLPYGNEIQLMEVDTPENSL